MIGYKHYRIRNRDRETLRWGLEGTVAVEFPTKEFLQSMFAQYGNVTLMNVGFARCNPRDQFEKKIGRETALAHMALRKCTLNKIDIRAGHRVRYIFEFSCKIEHPDYQDNIHFSLSTVAESDKVQLVYAYL